MTLSDRIEEKRISFESMKAKAYEEGNSQRALFIAGILYALEDVAYLLKLEDQANESKHKRHNRSIK